jgi:NAD(P)-dependent dehydrogenase (short-subunit alcohol dehydrogenase family)
MKSFKNNLKGQVAVVTGAGSGIGKSIALDFLRSGARVAGVGRRASRDGFLADFQEYGKQFLWIRADVSREPDVRRMVQQVLKTFGQIDILVNNAALRGPTTPVSTLSAKDWRQVLDTNLTGAFLCARECVKDMIKRRRGRIINISSMAGRMAYPLRASYAASKWGLIGFTVTLAQEAGAHNIQVNAVCPGPVEGAAIEEVITARTRALGLPAGKVRQQFLRRAALNRMVDSTDVSRTVLFLCSDAARNITGQAIDVSAGYRL